MKPISGLPFLVSLGVCISTAIPADAQEGMPSTVTAVQVLAWSPDTTKFKLRCADAATAQDQGGGLIPLTESDKGHLPARPGHALCGCCALLPLHPGLHTGDRRITILNERKDDDDLLWLNYDAEGYLNGLDTLISTYGDGQHVTTEYAYRDQHGSLRIAQVSRETFRDEQDTMAYLIDTLLFEPGITRVDVEADGSGAPTERYGLVREPRDLTRHWMELSTYSAASKVHRRSLMQLVPPGKQVFQVAIGDLNGDSWNDYALVLQVDPEGPRALQIVFTDREHGFVQKALAMGLLPDRNSGGFHDPIGEPGLSGITIDNGHLVITQFGGSAWKWESRAHILTRLDGLYLTTEQSRASMRLRWR
ncbi:MAG: hypothetical protein IPN38_18755 [Flavobacteriales bacterium]|nr:hypothetical protein [Flavobacteriales bacterium]